MFKSNSQNEIDYESTIYKYLYKLPPKGGRYIVLDTETTGLGENAQVVELGAHEIINGKLTGNQFHIYIRPRVQMDQSVISIHKITNSFYDEYYSDVYESDKQNLLNFSKFLGNSLIFAHNAPFDMGVLNSELKYWGLNEIPTKRYRCSMRIFMDIIGKIDIKYSNTFTSLTNCCEYFKLKSNNKNFHNALFDSFMTSRMICKIYETLDKNVNLRKKLGYNQQAIDGFFVGSKRKANDIIKNNKNNKNKNIENKMINNNINNSAKDIKNIKGFNKLNILEKLNIKNNLHSNKKLKDLKFKNKKLDKIRLMINSEIEEKFKNIQPNYQNSIKNTQQKENIKQTNNSNINANINNTFNNRNEKEDEDFIDEEEIDDIFLELL
jgi:DNA polymerase III epsilon subunit family exonuclease